MITRIVLHNFQCHKDLTLDLGRSNVLQGNSNSGKTAVLRALYWVLYNEPSGDSYVSYWAKAKTKFKADEYTSVIVEVDGHVIERKRSNDFNGYIVDGTVYEALRTAVPDEVTAIFNIADASVQKQMDAPFLLSATPGAASQYLNSLAGLECVDEVLTIAKRKVADTTASVEKCTEMAESLEKEIRSYRWVGLAEKLLDKVNSLTPAIDELSRKVLSLQQSISSYKSIRSFPDIPDWLESGDKSHRIEMLEGSYAVVSKYVGVCLKLNVVKSALDKVSKLATPTIPAYTEKELNGLSKSIRDYRMALTVSMLTSKYLARVDTLSVHVPSPWEGKVESLARLNSDYLIATHKFRKGLTAINALSNLGVPTECKWSEKDASILIRSIRMYKSLSGQVVVCNERLLQVAAEIKGRLCPVCGRPLDGDTCLL